MTSDDPYVVDDTSLTNLVPALGFTAGANPGFAAPIEPSATYDSSTTYIDSLGVNLTVVTARGTNGQPTRITFYADDVRQSQARYVWQSQSGGYRLSKIIYEDWQQPDVLIRTNFTVDSAKVVVLSGAAGNWGQPLAARLRAAFAFLADVCLPAPGYGSAMPPSCRTIAGAKIMVGLLGVAGAGAGLVAAVLSGQVWGIRAAVVGMVTVTAFTVISAYEYEACPK